MSKKVLLLYLVLSATSCKPRSRSAGLEAAGVSQAPEYNCRTYLPDTKTFDPKGLHFHNPHPYRIPFMAEKREGTFSSMGNDPAYNPFNYLPYFEAFPSHWWEVYPNEGEAITPLTKFSCKDQEGDVWTSATFDKDKFANLSRSQPTVIYDYPGLALAWLPWPPFAADSKSEFYHQEVDPPVFYSSEKTKAIRPLVTSETAKKLTNHSSLTSFKEVHQDGGTSIFSNWIHAANPNKCPSFPGARSEVRLYNVAGALHKSAAEDTKDWKTFFEDYQNKKSPAGIIASAQQTYCPLSQAKGPVPRATWYKVRTNNIAVCGPVNTTTQPGHDDFINPSESTLVLTWLPRLFLFCQEKICLEKLEMSMLADKSSFMPVKGVWENSRYPRCTCCLITTVAG